VGGWRGGGEGPQNGNVECGKGGVGRENKESGGRGRSTE
jgi:hypothetical protein